MLVIVKQEVQVPFTSVNTLVVFFDRNFDVLKTHHSDNTMPSIFLRVQKKNRA